MEQKNYEYLADKVLSQDLGFGDSLKNDLEASMKLGQPTFNLVLSGRNANTNQEVKFEITNFNRKDENSYYMLNGPVKVHVKNPDTKEEKTGVFKLFYQKGFSMKEMLNIMNGGIEYKASREKGEEVHRIHFLSNKKDPETGEQKLSSVSFKMSDLAKKFSALPGIPTTQEKIEQMMQKVLSGDQVTTLLTKDNGEKVSTNITLSRNAGLILKDAKGDYVNLKNESLEKLGFERVLDQPNANKTANEKGNKVDNKVNDTTKALLEKAENPTQSQGKKIS